MNANIFALLFQYLPQVIAWIEAEKPTIVAVIQEAETLVGALQKAGATSTTAQATGGLALLGQLLSHAASTMPATPAVTPPK